MTAKDQVKVINAGFRIIRSDMHRFQIKVKDENSQNWSVLYNGMTSKAAVERKMKELLMQEKTIED